MPTPLVAFPWGSASRRRVRRSAMASEAARLTAVVVFPTPPFWLAIATIWAMISQPVSYCRERTYDDISWRHLRGGGPNVRQRHQYRDEAGRSQRLAGFT